MAVTICSDSEQANAISDPKEIWHDVENARWVVRTGADIETQETDSFNNSVQANFNPITGVTKFNVPLETVRSGTHSFTLEKHTTPVFDSADSEYQDFFWWQVVDVSEFLAAPLARYYAYYSTDHDTTIGGIAMAYSDDIYGPWKNYGEVFVDTVRTTNVAGGQTETPSVIIDKSAGVLRMFYQQMEATALSRFVAATVIECRGSQCTLSATSTDGLSWTVDDYLIFDVLPHGIMPSVGHTGYFQPFTYNNKLYAYSLLYGSDFPKFAMHTCIGATDEWVTDTRPLPPAFPLCVMEDGVSRKIVWAMSVVITWQGSPHLVAVLSNKNSGGAPGNKVIAIAPLSDDLREPLGKFTQIWEPTLTFETADIKSMTPIFVDETLYLFVVMKKVADYYVQVLKHV